MEISNCSIGDKTLLTSCLQKRHRALEYGSGDSTHKIASLVHSLVSVEHIEPWYERVRQAKTHNTTLFFRKPDLPHQNPDDGNFEQFESYITAPRGFPPFDVIIVDGRARYHCARFAVQHLSHEETIVFVDDFSLDQELMQRESRQDYLGVLDFLEIVDNEQRLFKFKIK